MISHIGILGKDIPVYSLAAAAGIIAAVIYMKLMVRRPEYRDLDRDLEFAFLYALAGTAIGSKLLYLAVESRHIAADLGDLGFARTLCKYSLGGFVFYGGMIGCISALYLYSAKSKISFGHIIQLMLPAFPLAHAFARCGCFLTGCCYGKETHSLLAVTYTDSQFAPCGVSLIPVQIIEAVFVLMIFLILHLEASHGMRGEKMLGSYLVIYGIGRFILEFMRGDGYRGYIGVLSVSQLISVVCVLAGYAFVYENRSRRKKAAA